MVKLVGHGYIGTAIATGLMQAKIPFQWHTHHDFVVGNARVIINAAGFTGVPNVDACESAKRETIEGNVVWPLTLERLRGDVPVVHITSGCIYLGDNDGQGWRESDPPNFTGSFYSLTKAVAEQAIQDGPNSHILRVRMPFSADNHPKSLLTKLRGYPTLVDSMNSLTCVEDLVGLVLHLISPLGRQVPCGVYNVVNPGVITTREIADAMGLVRQWFDPEDFAASVKAPRAFCTLNTEKLESVYPMRDVWTALEQSLDAITARAA